jgi:serine/threonine-protein kinase
MGKALLLPLGTSIGRYRLIATLGSGGMAHVYLAVMRGRGGFSKLVVLKIPHDAVAEDPGLLAMFLDEARLAARFSHPNVVQTYEIVEESGRNIIVMEYLDGQTLNELIVRAKKTERPLPLAMHLRIVVEALYGLHYAHELKDYDGTPINLVHRDVSPHNIFVTFDGQVKVLDFGVAKATISSHVTEAGTFKGKVRYMSREQLAGTQVDRRADIFAVGVLLWEAATGSKLWKETPDVEVISNVLGGNLPSPREANPEIDDKLEAIIRRATSPEREDRYPTCLDLQADIESYLEGLPLKQTLRDVAPYLAGLFAETRAQRTRTIDDQAARAEAEVSGYRVLSIGELPGAPMSTTLSAPITLGVGALGSGASGPGASTESLGGFGNAMSSPPPRSRSARLGPMAVVFLATSAIAVGLVEARWRQKPEPATLVQAPVTVAAEAPVAPLAVAEVHMLLSAQPLRAKLYLDDRALGSNPVMQVVPKDGASHTVRVEAKGYMPKTLSLNFDSDKEVIVQLEAEARPAAQLRTAPRPVARTAGDVPSAHPSAAPSAEAKPADVAAPLPSAGKPTRPPRRIDDSL